MISDCLIVVESRVEGVGVEREQVAGTHHHSVLPGGRESVNTGGRTGQHCRSSLNLTPL